MQRVDGFYLYRVGLQIHPLSELKYKTDAGPGTTLSDAYFPIVVAEGAIEPLITRSVFRLRTSVHAGEALLNALRSTKHKIQHAVDSSATMDFMDVYNITGALNTFEAVLGAELSLLPLYVVTQKAGFDTNILIEDGSACFPHDIVFKVPEAVSDLRQGAKCIAFELPTAAGFHLHRGNESVLHHYWDAVTGGKARPKNRNMGDYLAEMNKLSLGNPKVKTALRDLKDLHRNPLIHPEHSLDSVDDAIALMNGIHSVIVHMLREIPMPQPSIGVGTPTGTVLTPSPSASSRRRAVKKKA